MANLDFLETEELVGKTVDEVFVSLKELHRKDFEEAIFNMNTSIKRSEKVYDFGSEIGFSKGLASDVKESQKSIKEATKEVNKLMDEMMVLVNEDYIELIKFQFTYHLINRTEEDTLDTIFENVGNAVFRGVKSKDAVVIDRALWFVRYELEHVFED